MTVALRIAACWAGVSIFVTVTFMAAVAAAHRWNGDEWYDDYNGGHWTHKP